MFIQSMYLWLQKGVRKWKMDSEGQIIPQNSSIDASGILMSMCILFCHK